MPLKICYLIVLLSLGLPVFLSQSSAESQNGTLKLATQYQDGMIIVPDVCVLYDSKWQEITRIIPKATNCEFNQVSNGIYNVEFYQNDFLVGDLVGVNLTGGIFEERITTKRYGTLLFVVYYSDQETRFSKVQVDLFSHHNTLVDSAITDERGEAVFSKLWPNTKGGYYTAKAHLEELSLGEKSHLNVDEGFSHSYTIFTRVDRPAGFSIIEPNSPNYHYWIASLIVGIIILIVGLIFSSSSKIRQKFLATRYANSHYAMNLSKVENWMIEQLAMTKKTTGMPEVNFYYHDFPEEFQQKVSFQDYLKSVEKLEKSGIIQRATEITSNLTITDNEKRIISKGKLYYKLSTWGIVIGAVTIGTVITSQISSLPSYYLILVPIIVAVIQLAITHFKKIE